MDLTSRVAIFDDNPLAIDRLSEMLRVYTDLEIVTSSTSVDDILHIIESQKIQLLFLDIDFPGNNGLDLVSQINTLTQPPYIVMYTAYYDKFTDDSIFQRGEADYLLKPVDPRELDKVVQRYRYYSPLANQYIATLHPLNTPGNDSSKIVVALTQRTSEMRVLHLDDIGYFHHNSNRHLWEAITKAGVVSLSRQTSATDILKYSSKLIQTHQRYIVNIDYVMLIGKNQVNLFEPFQQSEVLVGRVYLKNIQQKLMIL